MSEHRVRYDQSFVATGTLSAVSGPPPARPAGQVLRLQLQTLAVHICPNCGELCFG